MAEIRKRQNALEPGVDYSELHIPDDSYLGTGRYALSLQPNAIIEQEVITDTITNSPTFQMSVNINSIPKDVSVSLGKADGSAPISSKSFSLPKSSDLAGTHRFEAAFESWEIKSLKMNGMKLLGKS